MRIFPAKDNARRTEQELRFQPFTLLAAVPVALVVAAAFTYTCVYSDSQSEVSSHALLSGALCLPFIILFALVWKKETRRPFSLQARRIVWRMMFFGYIAATVGVVWVAIIFKASGSKLIGMILWFVIGLPMGHILYRLSTTNEK